MWCGIYIIAFPDFVFIHQIIIKTEFQFTFFLIIYQQKRVRIKCNVC